jgi:5-methylcytosine-specific restriction protein A
MEPFISYVTEEEIKQEKIKARKLRQSQWWKRKRAPGVCYFCGRKISPKDLTMEHVVPLIRGGKSTKGNVVPACKDCNNKKKYLLPIEWDEYIQRLEKDSRS